MKLTILFLPFILLSSSNFGQQNKFPNSGTPVKVIKWNEAAAFIPDEFWLNKKGELVNQIEEEEFKRVSTYCCQNLPSQMVLFNGHKLGDTTDLHARLNKLKLYLIATFKNIHEGVDRGEYCILRVPYNENRNWDSTAKWDTVYFIIKREFVTEIN
jgi:hypothetical protein